VVRADPVVRISAGPVVPAGLISAAAGAVAVAAEAGDE
jgi:hypothetical protein